MKTTKRSSAQVSLTSNIATSIFLSTLCVASYATLLALFLTQGMHTRSLTHVHGGIIPPTAVVSLLGIILIGSTSALVTRAVEHGVWAKILHSDLERDGRASCTRQELHRRAQWSVSHFERLTYTFRGQSWSMRISGILLLSSVLLNPVLLYGVSQKDVSASSVAEIDASQPPFSGFISLSGATFTADDPVTIGTLLHLKNVSVPSSPLCLEPSCTIETRATALQAKCAATTTIWDPPFFTSDGDFAVLFGVWYGTSLEDTSDNATSKPWHTVDCQIHYGTVSIQQHGKEAPELDRDSFVESSQALRIVGNPTTKSGFAKDSADYEMSAPFFWQSAYLSKALYGKAGGPPFTFAIGNNKVEGSLTLAQALLGVPSVGDWPTVPLANNREDAEDVARDLQASFDVATLLAFVAAPHAAPLSITMSAYSRRWVYDARVLPMLAIPLLATLVVCSIHWRIYDDETVIGYDPLEIARRANEIAVASHQEDDEGSGECETDGRNSREVIYG